MNRIYQGKVTAVEIPDGKDEWKKLDAGEAALWQHHKLFQDAVNYYLLALLSLANDRTPGLGEIKRRVSSEKEEDEEYHIWLRVKKHGKEWQGMRESICKHLLASNPKATFLDFCGAVLDGCEADETVREAALLELLDLCNGDGAIQKEGRAMLPRFCSPAYKGDFPRSAAANDKKSAKEWLPVFLYAPETESDLNSVRQRLKFELFANRDLTGRILDAAESRKRLTEMLDWLIERHAMLAPEKERLQKIITSLPDSFTLPAWRGGSVNKEALQARFYAWLFFEHIETSQITFAVLRDSFSKPKEKKSGGKTILPERAQIEFSDDPIKLARGKRGYVFKTFTSLLSWEESGDANTFRKEFDVLAFKEALKSFNQMKQKTDERREEQKKKRAQISAMRDAEAHKAWKGDGWQSHLHPA